MRVHTLAASFSLLIGIPTTGFGQQLPAACSAADQQSVAQYTQPAIHALLDGRTARFTELSQELEAGLSSGCRAALARSHPASIRCSEAEKSAALSADVDMMAAAVA